jgi:methylmalonyl-CoA carboxyltransferase small subunit
MKLKITVEGKVYEVEVEVAESEPTTGVRYVQTGAAAPSAPIIVSAPSGGGGEAVADETKVCRSPLAGVVSEVNVEVGQEVTAEQQLLVLEAMKMFTTITSPVAGKIKSVRVEKTTAVKQGQVLVEFE